MIGDGVCEQVELGYVRRHRKVGAFEAEVDVVVSAGDVRRQTVAQSHVDDLLHLAEDQFATQLHGLSSLIHRHSTGDALEVGSVYYRVVRVVDKWVVVIDLCRDPSNRLLHCLDDWGEPLRR